MSLRVIGMRAENMMTILSVVVNIMGGAYDQLMNTGIFTLIMNKRFIWVAKIMRKMATASIQYCMIFVIVVYFMS